MRFWLSQVITRPALSVKVLPSASLVTAEAAPPFCVVDKEQSLCFVMTIFYRCLLAPAGVEAKHSYQRKVLEQSHLLELYITLFSLDTL